MQRGAHVCQRSDKVKYGRPIWRGMQRGAHQRSNEVKYGRLVRRGMHWGMHVCQRSDEVKYGRPIGRGMQRDAHVCQRSDEVKSSRDQLDGACRGVRTRLSEEQHAENGAHHLNLLLLNHFSSNFVFVITYHAARQIIERPCHCHLLSYAAYNSKLTTLPQSQRRWQPSWQRILEARQIIKRLTKDPVTLFHNISLFILEHA